MNLNKFNVAKFILLYGNRLTKAERACKLYVQYPLQNFFVYEKSTTKELFLTMKITKIQKFCAATDFSSVLIWYGNPLRSLIKAKNPFTRTLFQIEISVRDRDRKYFFSHDTDQICYNTQNSEVTQDLVPNVYGPTRT